MDLHLLTELYPLVPFPPSAGKQEAVYTSRVRAWGPVTSGSDVWTGRYGGNFDVTYDINFLQASFSNFFGPEYLTGAIWGLRWETWGPQISPKRAWKYLESVEVCILVPHEASRCFRRCPLTP